MKYAVPAAALTLVLLCLWALSTWRRLTALRMDADQALVSFHALQPKRINALAGLVDLTNEYAPGAVRVRGDVVLSCCTMITHGSSLSDIGKRERTMEQILTEIVQTAQQHADMRSDARCAEYMSEIARCEKLSRESRLLYNKSTDQLNRELLRFPASVLGRLFGLRRREPIVTAKEETPIYQVFPPLEQTDAAPCDGLFPSFAGQNTRPIQEVFDRRAKRAEDC